MGNYKDNGNDLLTQWGITVLARTAKLPQPYRSHFEDWLGQQFGVAQFDPAALVSALEHLPPSHWIDVTTRVEATLCATEQVFGAK